MLETTGHKGYSINEVATLLKFHPDTVRYWLRTGELSGIRDDNVNEWRVAPEEIVAFMRQSGEIVPSELSRLQ